MNPIRSQVVTFLYVKKINYVINVVLPFINLTCGSDKVASYF
ncbi:MAG: hypothetical protein AAB587_00040 [Patescibacteria group bacterium]